MKRFLSKIIIELILRALGSMLRREKNEERKKELYEAGMRRLRENAGNISDTENRA